MSKKRQSITELLGMSRPLVAAAMAGGPSSPQLVQAAAAAGGIGFLGAGYQSAEALAHDIATVRQTTQTFGVNLFSPNPIPVESDAFDRFVKRVSPYAARFGIDVGTPKPVDSVDREKFTAWWDQKIQLLIDDPVSLVSFTFGLPPDFAISRLKERGTLVAQTVTTADEAQLAEAAGVDLLIVQGHGAGGHSGTFTPSQTPQTLPLSELVKQVRGVSSLPIWAAGGIATALEVQKILSAGAEAAILGTVLLLTIESGANSTHQAALRAAISGERDRGEPVLTRAFSGRPAQALPNELTRELSVIAPLGYPAIHYVMGPIRKAAATNGDPEWVSIWAGIGFRGAREESLKATFERLTP